MTEPALIAENLPGLSQPPVNHRPPGHHRLGQSAPGHHHLGQGPLGHQPLGQTVLGQPAVDVGSAGAHALGRHGHWLQALPENWPAAVCRSLLDGAPAVVRVAVAEVRGSAPREPGACMLVSDRGLEGTIGGGNLEWHAVRAARTFLNEHRTTPCVRIERLVLAKELAQCCGGVVKLWIERFSQSDLPLLTSAAAAVSQGRAVLLRTELSEARVSRALAPTGTDPAPTGRKPAPASHEPAPPSSPPAPARSTPAPASTAPAPASPDAPRFLFAADDENTARLLERIDSNIVPLWLYGAGHVGQALVRVLTELPFETTWIDTRAELMPADLPDNVHPLLTHDPVQTLATAPDNTRFLIMTHDHALDYDLCRAILQRNSFAWLGLIGSKSKGARFRSRLAQDGIAPEIVSRLVCPIGVTGIASKQPAAIAIAVAAQLLQLAPDPAQSSLRPSAPGTAIPASEIYEPAAVTPAWTAGIEPCPATDCAQCRPTRGQHT